MALLNTLTPGTDGYLCPGFMPQSVAVSGYLCSLVITEAPGRVGTGGGKFILSGNEKWAQLRQDDDDIIAIMVAITISGDLDDG